MYRNNIYLLRNKQTNDNRLKNNLLLNYYYYYIMRTYKVVSRLNEYNIYVPII